ncbi:class I SAM-dependent methyltransferase [Micromonospora sp. NPDC050397]|uniref:class I SAM-dependent methyltransferase n=1 Tax=Micromonospora sp. NPDC050397 TaxID=3364279 RepID=UPI00384C4972
MDQGLGFRGEVVDFYHRYRRGYPAEVVEALATAFHLGDDTVIDLGCGTGQLTVPVARRVRAVIGVDPEPDMLARARSAATAAGVTNVTWALGADTDLPAMAALLGTGRLGAVTIGQALHWMRPDRLFPALFPLLRAGGGVAVVTNGAPLWLLDTPWSRALRAFLTRWLGTEPTYACGTDTDSEHRYRDDLTAAGFEVGTTTIEYATVLDLEQLAGNLYSAFSVDLLPAPDQRPRFAEELRHALAPERRFTEHVRVRVLTGTKR